MPDQTFSSPESSGGFAQGDVGVGVRSMSEFVVYDSIDTPNADTAEIKSVGLSKGYTNLGLNGQFGLLKNLDLVANNGWGLKASAEVTPNWKISLAGVQDWFRTSSASVSGIDTFTADVSKKSVIAAVGYRINETILIYSNLAWEWFQIHSSVKRSDQIRVETNGAGNHDRIGAGVDWEEHRNFHFLLEANLIRSRMTLAKDHNGSSAGFSFKYSW